MFFNLIKFSKHYFKVCIQYLYYLESLLVCFLCGLVWGFCFGGVFSSFSFMLSCFLKCLIIFIIWGTLYLKNCLCRNNLRPRKCFPSLGRISICLCQAPGNPGNWYCFNPIPETELIWGWNLCENWSVAVQSYYYAAIIWVLIPMLGCFPWWVLDSDFLPHSFEIV